MGNLGPIFLLVYQLALAPNVNVGSDQIQFRDLPDDNYMSQSLNVAEVGQLTQRITQHQVATQVVTVSATIPATPLNTSGLKLEDLTDN